MLIVTNNKKVLGCVCGGGVGDEKISRITKIEDFALNFNAKQKNNKMNSNQMFGKIVKLLNQTEESTVLPTLTDKI